MKKIINNQYVSITTAIAKSTHNGAIIAGMVDTGKIYKLTRVQQGKINKYAMVSLDGRVWHHDAHTNKFKLLNNFEGDLYLFENSYDYIEWLKEVL